MSSAPGNPTRSIRSRARTRTTPGLRRAAPVAGVLAAALLYTLACPPWDHSALAWLVPGLLLGLTRDLSPWRAFACGGLFGVLIGLGITHWAFHASLEYFDFNRVAAGAFVLAVWIWCAGLPYGLLAASYAIASRRAPRFALPALGAWLWVVFEILRSVQFAGMPWELLGHTQWRNLALLQVADLGGMYAVSFVVAIVSLSAAECLRAAATERPTRGALLRWGAVPAALVAAVLAYGAQTRAALEFEPAGSSAPSTPVAIVQASVPNQFRWKRIYFERTLAIYADLTRGTAEDRAPSLVVWPENAVDFYLERDAMLGATLREVARASGAELLLGAPRLIGESSVRNSAYLIDRAGDVVGIYDKQRLVPFAEYDPVSEWIGRGDGEMAYGPGSGSALLVTPQVRAGMAICYEILFPQFVRGAVRGGAEFLVNLSNDSWMDSGDGVAPRQHLSMAAFRAVETRRFLVRASSSGVSGFVSPLGEVFATIPVGSRGVTVADVTPRRDETVYVRWGDTWVVVGAVGAAFALRGARAGGLA